VDCNIILSVDVSRLNATSPFQTKRHITTLVNATIKQVNRLIVAHVTVTAATPITLTIKLRMLLVKTMLVFRQKD